MVSLKLHAAKFEADGKGKETDAALRDAIDPALPLGLGEVPYGPLQVMHLQADTSALQEDTGWRPATPFEEGIRETIEWVRKETK